MIPVTPYMLVLCCLGSALLLVAKLLKRDEGGASA